MLKNFAEDLKYIREENNISLRDVSNKTRLNISILENLEIGDYNFQPQAYIRAFLKQYITAIGLDPEEVLFDYDLARSGKYKSKRQNQASASEINTAENITEEKRTVSEKIQELTKSPDIASGSKIKEESSESAVSGTQEKTEVNETAGYEYKPRNRFTINTNTSKPSSVNPEIKKTPDSLSFLNSPVLRNIVLIFFAVLIIAGLYSLINMIFFEGSRDKPEIIRQNFNDVVNEQERKILGKRSPEEIQDSIRKAEEMLNADGDSVILSITSVLPGTVYIVTDSVNYGKPDKIEFEKNMTGEFKAKKFFHISTANTSSFKAKINNKTLNFDSKSVSKVKINKDGIVKN